MKTITARFAGGRISAYRMASALQYACWLFALITALSIGSAFAAEGLQKQIQIDIHAGTTLEDALLQWGNQTGMQVMMSTGTVRNAKVQAVQGTTRAATVLSTLLKGAGLSYTVDGNTVRVIQATTVTPPAPLRLSDSSNAMSDLGEGTLNKSQDDIHTKEGDFQIAQLGATPNQNDSHGKSMEEVTVTAQKRAERLQDVPISISVVGGEDLDKSTFSGVTEALNTVPGVSAFANQFQTSGTLLSFRGVGPGSYSGGGTSTVAYYLDSVPFGMIYSAVVPDPNVYDLQQIEVLRGPQGTLYGANALNGVVRVLTASPDLNSFDFKTRGVLSTTEGGGANYSGDMAVNIPIIDGRLAARASVGDDHESGWISGPLGAHLNDGEIENARLKVRAQMTDSFSIDLSAWHSQSLYGGPAEADANNHNAFFVVPQPMHSQFNAYGAKVNYDTPQLSLSSATSYVDYRSIDILDIDFAVPYFPPRSYDVTDLNSKVLSEEVNLTYKVSGPWRWSAGAMYRDDKEHNFVLAPYPDVIADFDDTSRSVAVYGEVGYRFLQDMLQWTVGVRYFHDDESTFANQPIPAENIFSLARNEATSSATTPRLVLSWFPSKDLTGYVSYSQGFRSGQPQNEQVGTAVQSFPAAKPDKLSNYEMGVKGTLWNRLLSYDVAVYHMKWQNIQQELSVLINGGPNTAYVLLNGNSASGHGADVSIKTQPLDGVTLGADFSWNTLHFDSTVYSGGVVLYPEGSRPNYSPEYTAGLSAQYVFPLGASGLKGVLSVSGNYVSPLDTTYLNVGTVQTESNSLLLTRGTLGIETPDHWVASLFVDNANNYHGSQYPDTPPFESLSARVRPRTYGIRFDYHLR